MEKSYQTFSVSILVLLLSMLCLPDQTIQQNCGEGCQKYDNSSCYSDGWVYLNTRNIPKQSIKKLFDCSQLQNNENCSRKCSKDVCIMNCPVIGLASTIFGFSFKCYSDGVLYTSSCEANCQNQNIFEVFTCKNNTLRCRKMCKDKQSEIHQLSQEMDLTNLCQRVCDNSWNPSCSLSGKVFDNECLLKCNGKMKNYECSQKGLSFNIEKCSEHCSRNALTKEQIQKIKLSQTKNVPFEKFKPENMAEEIKQKNLNRDLRSNGRRSRAENSYQIIEVENDSILIKRGDEEVEISGAGNFPMASDLSIKETDEKKSSSQIRSSSRFNFGPNKKKKIQKRKREDTNIPNLKDTSTEETSKQNNDVEVASEKKDKKPKKEKVKKRKKTKPEKKIPKKNSKKREKKNSKKKVENKSKDESVLDNPVFEDKDECLQKCQNKNSKKIVCFSNGRLYVDLCKAACDKFTPEFICPKEISLRSCAIKCKKHIKNKSLSN
jgi:hypothetical protein